MNEEKVQESYDNNTRRFLRLGASSKEMSIHRAVWTKGVRDRSTALETVNRLILNKLVEWVNQNAHSHTAHVPDLGWWVVRYSIWHGIFQEHRSQAGLRSARRNARWQEFMRSRLG